jgi:hypothetical protein
METISSPIQAINSVSSTSPRSRDPKKPRAGKGDLPPPCPAGTRRRVPVPPCSQTRKSKRRQRQLKASKENARSTSVMDLEDEEDEEEIEDEISQASGSNDSIDDGES